MSLTFEPDTCRNVQSVRGRRVGPFKVIKTTPLCANCTYPEAAVTRIPVEHLSRYNTHKRPDPSPLPSQSRKCSTKHQGSDPRKYRVLPATQVTPPQKFTVLSGVYGIDYQTYSTPPCTSGANPRNYPIQNPQYPVRTLSNVGTQRTVPSAENSGLLAYARHLLPMISSTPGYPAHRL